MTLSLDITSIDAGYVTGRKEFDVVLTNTGGASVTVTGVDLPSWQSGLAIAGAQPPLTLAAGASATFTLIVRRNGDEHFTGVYTFNSASSSASVSITGERIAFIDLDPNWGESVKIGHSFKTDIWLSEDGTEKRVAQRHQPRRALECAFLLKPDRFAEFRALFQGALSHRLLVADPTRSVELEAGSTATVLNFPTGTPWAVPGAFVVMADGEFAQIASISNGAATLERPLPKTYAGGSVVRPGFCGYSGNRTRMRTPTDTIGQFAITVDEVPGQSDPDLIGAQETLFNGREVMPFTPDFRSGLNLDPTWELDVLDHGHGTINVERPHRFVTVKERQTFNLAGDNIRRFVDLFSRMRGQQGEFYQTTGLADIKLVPGNEAPVSGYILAMGESAAQFLEDDPTVRAVEALTPSGRVRHQITGFSVLGENTLIQLDGIPLVDPADWFRVSWFQVRRFATDDLTVSYQTDSIATITTATQTIEDL